MGLINSDCTIYHRNSDPSGDYDTFERIYVPECWWFLNTKSSITTEGLKTGDVLTVRIFDLSVQVKKGDILIRGNCPEEIQTVKDLKGCQYFKVTAANYNDFGSNPHIKVVAV